ncbi:nuclear transport factor 2 family protein [Streptomyces bambusae]|uniref:nuclear transport factor 2 family protein n=1 Tax=Streptomyces bambusae TaxID=1550616 RepID=UPI001CFDA7EF|nr:nuclear transport factor 2 family protein [Streptomyces bambusae]MCB5163793.1 nuclear transport factor 2 family protein [Streptomyces bambusae]
MSSSRALPLLLAATALCTATATATAHAAQDAGHRPPKVVADWARAWNGSDPQALGALFTADGTYTDKAVGVTFRGREEIAGWKARADRLIADVRVTVRSTHRSGGRITVRAVYSGHLKGAPKPFAVPMTTLLDLDGRHPCRIAADEDHYDLGAVLTQSGLPADWTPPSP